MAGQGVVIKDGFIGKEQVYLFLVAHREHAIPRQSQMLSLRMFYLFIFKFFIMSCFYCFHFALFYNLWLIDRHQGCLCDLKSSKASFISHEPIMSKWVLDYNVYTSLHSEARSYRYWSYWNIKQYLLLVTELYCIFILLLKNVKSFLGNSSYRASWIV